MAPLPGQNDLDEPRAGAWGSTGRFVGFLIAAGMAMAILAAVVWLPPLQRLRDRQEDHARLAAQVRSNERLIEYRRREIEQMKTDPALTERLLMQQQGYRPVDEHILLIPEAAPDPPIAAALAVQAEQPHPPHPVAEDLTRRAQDPRSRRGLLALAGLLLTGAMILFGPPERRLRRPSGTQ